MSSRFLAGLIVLLLMLALASQSLFIVHDNEHAALLRFGEVVDADLQPGLHALIPLVDDVRKFDARVQVSDVSTSPLPTADNNSLVLDSYVVWQVGDVRKFVAATGGSAHDADSRLLPLVREAFKDSLLGHSVHEIVSSGQVPGLGTIVGNLSAKAADVGIIIDEVRLRRVQYAGSAQDAVTQRMNTIFKAEAEGVRASARAQSDQIMAGAEAARRQIEADASRQAEQIRGQGDGEAAAITAKVAASDPEFYRFYRSMEMYRQSFSKPQDVLILRSDDDLLKYLKAPAK